VSSRRLIVNADDLGLSPGINRGIAWGHEHGIVTSASLMVRGPAASLAAEYAAAHPRLSVGLHVDLAEWRWVSGRWVTAYEVVPLDDPTAVSDEVDRQLERFAALVGRGPTHLDSHQHLHREEPLCSVMRERGRRLGVPVRDQTSEIRYIGGFYGQGVMGVPWPKGIGVEALCRLLRAMPDGITELGCHPGLDDDSGSAYGGERAVEVASLCDPRVRETVRTEGIALQSFPGALALAPDRSSTRSDNRDLVP
jgi:predicted glycoside hydrolase/deacetylase ChbG (UPF0249 family)